MSPKRTRKLKCEWHLYSAAIVTAVLSFISIQTAPAGSTAQVVATAFSAIVGMFLFASENWKAEPERFHISAIGIAIAVFLTWTILLKFLSARNSREVLRFNSNE